MHLTNSPDFAHEADAADHSAAGAIELEIEVTPGMADAGRIVADNYYIGGGEYLLTDDFFLDIFRAMLRESEAATVYFDVGSPMCDVKLAEAEASAGAPEVELMITPAMIRAGARKLVYFDIENDDAFRIIREVLAAMSEARAPVLGLHPRNSTEEALSTFGRLRVETLEMLFPNR